MRTLLILAFVALSSVALAGGKHHRYMGIHPVARSAGGGLCEIEGPHVHVYEPDRLQYRDHHGFSVFVGDPTAFGYKGPKYAYKGHHPVHVDAVVGDTDPDLEFCYLDGAHYHSFAPPPGELTLTGGVYFYTAKPPKAYHDARPRMVAINAVYSPIAYERPVVTVVAPVGWIGAHVEVVAPAPAVHVHARPGIYVEVGMPAVVIEHRHHRHKKWKKHKHKHRHHHHHGDHDD